MNRREYHRLLRFLLSRTHPERMRLLAEMDEDERREFDHVWRIHGRKAQHAPAGNWRTWLIMAGRGFGKTRAGAEWVRELAEADPGLRIALIGATLGEARAVMVEGESGILAISPPGRGPAFEPSLRRLTWPNGAEATLYSAGEPESLRGPQHHFACRAIPEGRPCERGYRPARRAAVRGHRSPARYPAGNACGWPVLAGRSGADG